MTENILPRWLVIMLILALFLSACQPAASTRSGKKTIVVTYSILGAVVKDLVGDRATVIVPMPNGQDPHEWEPSAKDIETLTRADLIVQNGLDLEIGMQKALGQAKNSGVKFFTASDHIVIRRVRTGEGLPVADPDQAVGAQDPHLWMDPVNMKSVVDSLAAQIKTDLGIDLNAQAKDLDARLDTLNQEIETAVQAIPEANRKLVTGHQSMGYFAQRYHFKLVGALIPSLGSQAEVSAADMAGLKKQIEDNQVKAIFTELGTSRVISEAIGQETGVKVLELSTHTLPPDGSYFTFMRNLTEVIVSNLK